MRAPNRLTRLPTHQAPRKRARIRTAANSAPARGGAANLLAGLLGDQSKVCAHYMAGRCVCVKGNRVCFYKHGPTPPGEIKCTLPIKATGVCTNGRSCKYLHDNQAAYTSASIDEELTAALDD